ncbi:hypothetical protein HAX54_003575 [Datura stramonium]|uniref:Uncharacterized protein n=1 Tax=Datura stramonium TaxID=4076 RepID=A0ABS8WW64_DATST|nr:hypothetical protein [Datura stramonium]
MDHHRLPDFSNNNEALDKADGGVDTLSSLDASSASGEVHHIHAAGQNHSESPKAKALQNKSEQSGWKLQKVHMRLFLFNQCHYYTFNVVSSRCPLSL